MQNPYTIRKLNWRNILFFGITSALALVGLPLYAIFVGLTAADWWLFGFMCFFTMMATTLGYHRLFAHRAFQAHPVIIFLNLFFGAAAFTGTTLIWASQHRDHHRYTDTARDPYNIKEGLWYAHMGWFLYSFYQTDFSNVRDLSSNKWIKHQHDYWIFWAIGAGIVFPLLIGLLTGSFWGAFFLGVCGRLTFIHQSIFCINSACHYFGKATYDLEGSARDSWVCAFLTHGEGYHSFHHRFPSDYRNGVRWYQWDPTKWLVRALSSVGLVSKLNRAPELQIVAVRSEVERKRFMLLLDRIQHPKLREALEHVSEHYERLRSRLQTWEVRAQEYRRLYQELRHRSSEILKTKAEQLKRARQEFFEIRREWVGLLRHYSVLFQPA